MYYLALLRFLCELDESQLAFLTTIAVLVVLTAIAGVDLALEYIGRQVEDLGTPQIQAEVSADSPRD